MKPIGAFTYYYNKGTGSCVTDSAGRVKLAQARAAVQDAALPTIMAIK